MRGFTDISKQLCMPNAVFIGILVFFSCFATSAGPVGTNGDPFIISRVTSGKAGQIELVVHSPPGSCGIIETSLDLMSWRKLGRFTLPFGFARFDLLNAPNFTRQFLRLRSIPCEELPPGTPASAIYTWKLYDAIQPGLSASQIDWILNPEPFVARVNIDSSRSSLTLENGLLRRVFNARSKGFTVGLANLINGEDILVANVPEARIVTDKGTLFIGSNDPDIPLDTKFDYKGYEVGPIVERLDWKRIRHHSQEAKWPPAGVALKFNFLGPAAFSNIHATVYYEMYDGIPCYSKWLTISNASRNPFFLKGFTSEMLATIDDASEKPWLQGGSTIQPIHVETEMALNSIVSLPANQFSVRWFPDHRKHTNVNYAVQKPMNLEAGPEVGPDLNIPPSGSFESFRTWVLFFDSSDSERRGMAMRKMYRTIAPWVTENPLTFHFVASDGAGVTNAIDQCVNAGFELLLLSFFSGFDFESATPARLIEASNWVAYAKSRNIEIGSYSLLGSRSIGPYTDIVSPPGQRPVFGSSPCIGSEWGAAYFSNLYKFHEAIEFSAFEHDGPYPGDACSSQSHPGHSTVANSIWTQWYTSSQFYKWCRSQGILLHVPDYYLLSGASKIPMGYSDPDFFLTREHQIWLTRRNIFNGTWQKPPTMGWMFVPLTSHLGNEEQAYMEPLDDNIGQYARIIESNLAMGVQAYYRGTRLYASPQTLKMVRKRTDWFKNYRNILESDIVHGRAADGHDLDWILHANPKLQEKALLAVFNPLNQAVYKEIRLDMRYTGISTATMVRDAGINPPKMYSLDQSSTFLLPVQCPPLSMKWFVFE